MRRVFDSHSFDVGQHTSTGPREHNEDFHFLDGALGLVIVADGVGGHAAGEVASRLTCEAVQREVVNGASLADAILQANRDVAGAAAKGIGKSGMASTVVAARISGNEFELAWVGDSRAYLWDGNLHLLTLDHSYVGAQLASGRITMAEAQNHPRKHVILQAIGLHKDDDIDVSTNRGQLMAGCTLLLCSDGVSDVLDNEQLARICARQDSATDICKRLVDLSIARGGSDNSTAVIVKKAGPLYSGRPAKSVESVVWSYDPRRDIYRDADGDEISFSSKPEQPSNTDLRALAAHEIAGTAMQQREGAAGARPNHRNMLVFTALLLGVAALALALWIN